MSLGFDLFVAEVTAIEGGYSDNPDDSGGETNFGITVAVARANGYHGSMREMPLDVAKRIYKTMYWDSLMLDRVYEMSPLIAKEMFDTGVNLGVDASGRFLQRCLNVLNLRATLYPDLKIDGRIGPMSLYALELFLKARGKNGVLAMLRLLNSLQGAFYVELAEKREKDEAFVYGWALNRVSM